MIDFSELAPGSLNRFNRVKELKGWDDKRTIEWILIVGWMVAEKDNAKKKEG